LFTSSPRPDVYVSAIYQNWLLLARLARLLSATALLATLTTSLTTLLARFIRSGS
jgi:hypothetical protein